MQKLPHTILVKAIPSLSMMVHFGNSNIIQFAIFLTIFRVFAINACNKRNIIYTLSITSQAFTLHLPYVLLFRNEDCFYDCLCSSVTVFLFLQLCRLDLGIQLCIYSHKTADEPRFFNWSNASDLWNRRCSHALCHLPSAIV